MKAPSKCIRCGSRSVRERKGAGRTVRYKTMPTMELPPELGVPTCGRCQALYLERMSQAALERTLRDTYTQSLRDRVHIALDELRWHVSFRRLEIKLGLSQGYLSRLRARAGNPSSELVCLLALLAIDPSLLNELERFWATPDTTWQPSGSDAMACRVRRRKMNANIRRIAKVRDRTDIVSVIGQYVKLLRNGADYFGACPFHDDQDASFHVSVSKQFYYCFGCQRSGDVIRFLCDKENRTQAAVVADLARRAGFHE